MMSTSMMYCRASNGTIRNCQKQIVECVCLQIVFMLLGIIFFCDLWFLFSPYKFAIKVKPVILQALQETVDQTENTLAHCSYFYLLLTTSCLLLWLKKSWSVYWAAGVEHAELQGHRTDAERSQPLCSDILFKETHFLCLA